jgi:endonuclease/exonuclease/phosphatase (EEP) superfamily protein YafD
MNLEAVIRITLFVIGYLTVLVSLIPLLRYEAWYIRIFDYPRSQKFWINLAVLFLFVSIYFTKTTHDFVFAGLLAANQFYLLSQIWDYTVFARNQMKRSTKGDTKGIGLLIANVFQDNKDFQPCKDLIRTHRPDIFLLVETDEDWMRAMNEFSDDYPYKICQPQSNTYGICLFSKIRITQGRIRFLIDEDIPSIEADFETPHGETFRLYGLHPRPPVPHESPDSTPRDAEILTIGKEAKRHPEPVIVAGDLNDVAWSFTTNLFLKTSGLLDPRIGRGFFSTFHAHHRFLRWPLDHVFLSSHFSLMSLQRLGDIGSDHFPIYIRVVIDPTKIQQNKDEERVADEKEKEIAEEKISEAKSSDR